MWEEGDIAGMIPMVVRPDDRRDGVQCNSVVFENLTDIVLHLEARYYISKAFLDDWW